MEEQMNGMAQEHAQAQSAITADANVLRVLTELNRLAPALVGIAVVAIIRDGNAAKMVYLPPDGRLMSLASGELLGASVQAAMAAEQMKQQRNISPILRPPGIMGG